MIRVLFVCLGNICRSPMAEAVFAHKVRLAGLESVIEADSAGTGEWHVGRPPHPGTLRILQDRQIPCTHSGRQVTSRDLNDFDYVIVMDEMNLQDVRSLGTGRAKVARLMDYAPEKGVTEVPDPYYEGGFEGVYELVDAATEGLLAAVVREHNLTTP